MSATTDRVVVGVTDHPSAGHTLTWALNQAAASRSRLVVVRAGMSRRAVMTAAAGTLAAFEAADAALARAVTAARRTLGEQRVGAVIDQDEAGDVLLRTAGPGDLIVVGAPQRPGWWIRASTTSEVIGGASGPVVVVPPTDAEPSAAGIGRYVQSHVVVGVDGSPPSRAALEFAFEFADQRGLPLAAVTVTERTDYDVWFDDTMLETHLGVEPAAADRLAAEVDPWRLKFADVAVRRALVAGEPADGLRRVAQGASLLAVGSSAGSALLGSVARDLAGHSPCPVAILPAMR